MTIIVIAVVVLAVVPYAIQFGATRGVLPVFNDDGAREFVITNNLPCKYGSGSLFVDLDVRGYPLDHWCPYGYYFVQFKIQYTDQTMVGHIIDNELNGKPRGNKLPVGIRDQYKEVGGQVIVTTRANKDGFFYLPSSIVIPSTEGPNGTRRGSIVLEVDGVSQYGCSEFTFQKQLTLADFKDCLEHEGYSTTHEYFWEDR